VSTFGTEWTSTFKFSNTKILITKLKIHNKNKNREGFREELNFNNFGVYGLIFVIV
jgi:hypothetical protein